MLLSEVISSDKRSCKAEKEKNIFILTLYSVNEISKTSGYASSGLRPSVACRRRIQTKRLNTPQSIDLETECATEGRF